MAFEPIEFAKEGEENRFAWSPAEVTELVFAGWTAIGEGTPYEPRGLSPHELEAVQDAIYDTLVAGANVSIVYDDENGTVTIAATGGGTGGLDVEAVQDAVAAMIGEGPGLSAVYDDAAGTYTINVAAPSWSQITSKPTLDQITPPAADVAMNSKKITGLATGTANDHAVNKGHLDTATTDAKNRANHFGTQTSASISDLTEAVQDIVGAFLAGGTGITVSYNDAGNVATITAIGGGGTWDSEQTRDTIGAALIGTGLVSINVNDAGDTITISTTATANSTDAALRDRSTHTGSQTASTISDLTEAVQDIVGAFISAGTGASVAYNDATNSFVVSSTITQYTDEQVRDVIGAALVAGTGVTLNVNDAGDTITINATGSGGLTLEEVQDAVATMIAEGTGLTAVYDDTNGIYTISPDMTVLAELIRDTMGTALTAGANISVTPNDAGDIITIAVTGLGTAAFQASTAFATSAQGTKADSALQDNAAFLERVEDIIAATIVAGTNVTTSYDDATGRLTINASGGGGSTDAEVVRDTIGGALVAGAGITINVNDAGDTITIATTGLASQADLTTVNNGLNTEATTRANWDTFLSKQAFATTRLTAENGASCRYAGEAAQAAYRDAGNKVFDWSSETAGGAVTGAGAAVASNRLYADNATLPAGQAILPIGLGATENAHISFIMQFRSGSGAALYFGVDSGALGHAPTASSADAMLMGITSGGAHSTAGFIGTTADDGYVSAGVAVPTQSNIGSAPPADGTYSCSIDIGEKYISMSYRLIGSNADLHTMLIDRALFQSGGKTINNILLSIYDTRGVATGQNYGPVVVSRSLQPARTSVVAGITVQGAEHYHRIFGPRASQSDTERWRVSLPKDYDPRRPWDVVFFAHQTITGTDATPWADVRMIAMTKALNDAGFIVMSVLDGAQAADRFGNQAAIDNHLAAYRAVRDQYNTGQLFFLTASGGAFPVLNGIQRAAFPTPAAVAMIGPGTDLEAIYNGPDSATFQPLIKAAYGIASDSSDYAAKTSGWDPSDALGAAYRGIPFRIYTTASDPTAPRETHVDPLVAKITPYSTSEVSIYVGTGGHLDSSQYQPTDVVNFFNRYRTRTAAAPAVRLVNDRAIHVLRAAEAVPASAVDGDLVARKAT